MLSRAQMRLADRSDACEGPGWARTEHMQQESGYVGGVPKMAAGAEAFLEDAGCCVLAGLTAERARWSPDRRAAVRRPPKERPHRSKPPPGL